MNDPRYKSGTSLTRTEKEEWRDRLLDLLPELHDPKAAEDFENALNRMTLDVLRQLVFLVGLRIEEEKQAFQKYMNADHAAFHKYLDAFANPRKRKIRSASDLCQPDEKHNASLAELREP